MPIQILNVDGVAMANAIARVYVNDIEVGTLPADQYNKIVKMVRADRRLYVAQAMNYFKVLLRCLFLTIRYVPTALFFALFLFEITSPSSVTDVIVGMRQSTPEAVNHGVCWLLGTGWIVSMLFVVVGMFDGVFPTGAVDQFDRKISHHIRSLLEVPAQGKMMVVVTRDADQ
ncbi:hypothetical protein ACXIVK_27830 [Paraburkholderia caledonica]